jgi:TolB-like protein
MTPNRPSADEVRAAIEKATASEYFASSGLLAGLLRSLTEVALSLEADAPREKASANASAGRDAALHSGRPPAAAEEIELLRTRLEQYYDGPGRRDAVRISLPKGALLPRFVYAPRATALSAEELTPMPRGWKLAGILALLAVAGILLGWWQAASTRRLREAPIATIVVLPFENAGGDSVDEALSERLAKGIANQLARRPGLRVVDRSITAQFRGKPLSLDDAAARLNASMLVEGSVRRQGERLRVTARLVSVRSGAAIWSDRYELATETISAVADQIAQSIAAALVMQTRGAGTAAPAERRP